MQTETNDYARVGRPQSLYVHRLPYGVWVVDGGKTEVLFDRGYCAIAERPVKEPKAARLVEEQVHYPDIRSTKFYYSDRSAPEYVSDDQTKRLESILARFILGRKV